MGLHRAEWMEKGKKFGHLKCSRFDKDEVIKMKFVSAAIPIKWLPTLNKNKIFLIKTEE